MERSGSYVRFVIAAPYTSAIWRCFTLITVMLILILVLAGPVLDKTYS